MGQHKQREVWQQQNADFLQTKAKDPEVKSLGKGVSYRILETGTGDRHPEASSVVTCHYKGTLICGKTFDSSYDRGCLEAFRCIQDLTILL